MKTKKTPAAQTGPFSPTMMSDIVRGRVARILSEIKDFDPGAQRAIRYELNAACSKGEEIIRVKQMKLGSRISA